MIFLGTGVPVGLVVSTRLRQLTFSDPSQLTLLLSEILTYAMLTTSIEAGVATVVHFNPRKHFSLCLLEALTSSLAPQASAFSLLVVEKLLCWVTATLNIPEDLQRIDMAQKLLADTAGYLIQHAPSGIRLLSKQVCDVHLPLHQQR